MDLAAVKPLVMYMTSRALRNAFAKLVSHQVSSSDECALIKGFQSDPEASMYMQHTT